MSVHLKNVATSQEKTPLCGIKVWCSKGLFPSYGLGEGEKEGWREREREGEKGAGKE